MDMTHPTIPETLLISLIGFATVFIVLVVLMCIIVLISKVAGEKKAKPAAAPVEAAPVEEPAEKPYTGVKLHGVSDKEAAMLMAIVADEIGKPLDNLRFISIREVK